MVLDDPAHDLNGAVRTAIDVLSARPACRHDRGSDRRSVAAIIGARRADRPHLAPARGRARSGEPRRRDQPARHAARPARSIRASVRTALAVTVGSRETPASWRACSRPTRPGWTSIGPRTLPRCCRGGRQRAAWRFSRRWTSGRGCNAIRCPTMPPVNSCKHDRADAHDVTRGSWPRPQSDAGGSAGACRLRSSRSPACSRRGGAMRRTARSSPTRARSSFR